MTSLNFYKTLVQLEQNTTLDALQMLDAVITLNKSIVKEIKTLKGVQDRLKTIAGEILDELGVMNQETEHGKASWRRGGRYVTLNREALDDIAQIDPVFEAKYEPHRKEKVRRDSLVLK